MRYLLFGIGLQVAGVIIVGGMILLGLIRGTAGGPTERAVLVVGEVLILVGLLAYWRYIRRAEGGRREGREVD